MTDAPDREPTASASRPGPGRRALFSAILTLVLLVLLEGALRLGGFVYDPSAHAPAESRRLELDDARLFERDPEVFWRLLPSREFDLGDIAYPRFRTNALGLRGAEIPPQKAAGELRILCLGDSVTFGVGLEEGTTWPEQLEAELSRDAPAGYQRVTVLNAGMPGYSSVQGRRLLARLGAFEPDVVLFWFGMNDAKPAFGPPDAELDPSAAQVSGAGSWSAGIRLLQLADWIADRGGRPPRRVSPEEFARGVQQLRAAAQSAGGPTVVFVRMPNRLRETLAQLRTVERLAEAAGASEIDAPDVVLTTLAAAPESYMSPRAPGPSGAAEDPDVFWIGPAGVRRARVDLSELRRRIEQVSAWEAALAELLEGLPPAAVTTDDLFAGTVAGDVFMDNCHLTPYGAKTAARSLAGVIRARLAR